MSGDVVRALRAAREEGRAIGVSLEGLRTVPGWAVRLAAAVAAAALLLVGGFVGLTGPMGVLLGVAGAFVVVFVATRPRDGWCGVLLLVVGLRLLAGGPPGAGRLAAVVLAAHVAVVLGVLAPRVPWRGGVEVAVLAGLARRAAPLQLGAQALALVLRPVMSQPGPGAAGWRIAALVVAAGLVAAVLPPRRRPPG